MKFRFDLSRCAYGNMEKAVVRESTRMACIAWCLQHLGHDVCAPEELIPNVVKASPRYEFEPFLSLDKSDEAGITVCAEKQQGTADVLFKTSVNTTRDRENIGRCRVYMAHEYDPVIDDSPNLLPVPFLVHDLILGWFVETGKITSYLRNELDAFRNPLKQYGSVGFIGYDGYGRAEMAAEFKSICTASIMLYKSPPLTPERYMAEIADFSAGLLFSGDTPKTNRHSELALLGIPIISTRRPVRDTPDLSHDNCILLDSWDDAARFEEGMFRRYRIVAAADACYHAGWSPMGQARLLAERLNDQSPCHGN